MNCNVKHKLATGFTEEIYNISCHYCNSLKWETEVTLKESFTEV